MNDIEIKRKLRNILAHKNMSMSQLAREVGVSEGTVRKLLDESKDLPPSARIMSHLHSIKPNYIDRPEYKVNMFGGVLHVMRDVSFNDLFHYLRNLEEDLFDLVIAEDNTITIIPKSDVISSDDHSSDDHR